MGPEYANIVPRATNPSIQVSAISPYEGSGARAGANIETSALLAKIFLFHSPVSAAIDELTMFADFLTNLNFCSH